MSVPTPLDRRLESKHLFIEHLAMQLEAMERSGAVLEPVAYRLCARRLRQACAGYPEARLAAKLAGRHPVVNEVMAVRHFESHGVLPGPAGSRARSAADDLLARLRRRAA